MRKQHRKRRRPKIESKDVVTLLNQQAKAAVASKFLKNVLLLIQLDCARNNPSGTYGFTGLRLVTAGSAALTIQMVGMDPSDPPMLLVPNGISSRPSLDGIYLANLRFSQCGTSTKFS